MPASAPGDELQALLPGNDGDFADGVGMRGFAKAAELCIGLLAATRKASPVSQERPEP